MLHLADQIQEGKARSKVSMRDILELESHNGFGKLLCISLFFADP